MADFFVSFEHQPGHWTHVYNEGAESALWTASSGIEACKAAGVGNNSSGHYVAFDATAAVSEQVALMWVGDATDVPFP